MNANHILSIQRAGNGLIVHENDACQVFETRQHRATAMREMLQRIAAVVVNTMETTKLDVRIEVRDRTTGEEAETSPPSLWLSPDDVEREYNLPQRYLEQLRRDNIGPRYSKPTAKQVRYRRSDVEDWLTNAYQPTQDQPCS